MQYIEYITSLLESNDVRFFILSMSLITGSNAFLYIMMTTAINELRSEGINPTPDRIVLLIGMINIILLMFCGTVVAGEFGIR